MPLRRLSNFFGLTRPAPKVALVLGGGAARGLAHIGVIQELERQQLPIDLIVGTSVGSLIGAIYAFDGDSARLEAVARPLTRKDVFAYDLKTVFRGVGLASGEGVTKFVKKHAPAENIEDLKIPFVAVATDLNRGERVVLNKGPLATAVRASCAIPGIFPPVEHAGRLLVDGWVLENLPVATAREMGADIVIAVDVSTGLADNHVDDLVDVIVQSITIMSLEHMKRSRSQADVLVTPELSTVGRLDFDKKELCLAAGAAAVRQAAPDIRQRIEAWKKPGWRRRRPP